MSERYEKQRVLRELLRKRMEEAFRAKTAAAGLDPETERVAWEHRGVKGTVLSVLGNELDLTKNYRVRWVDGPRPRFEIVEENHGRSEDRAQDPGQEQ